VVGFDKVCLYDRVEADPQYCRNIFNVPMYVSKQIYNIQRGDKLLSIKVLQYVFAKC
jgi:hypothetical protein